MPDQERADPPLADPDAVRLSRLSADEEAKDFVFLDPRIEQGYCLPGRPMVWAVNRHRGRRIRITIRTDWIYQDRPYSEFTDHFVHDRSAVRIGCTFPGPSQTQRFDREIHSAVFAD